MKLKRTREVMSAVDRAWLEMDDPHNPMVVSSVLELSDVDDVEGLVRHVVANLLRYRRFSQRVDARRAPPVWCDDGDLLLSYHVRIFHLAEDTPAHDIAHAVARELAHPLDRLLPLWRMTLFVRTDGRVTLLFRAHHAIADGIALMGVLMSCTDSAPRHARSEQHHRDLLERMSVRLGKTTAQLRRIGALLFDGVHRRQYVDAQLRAGREALAAVGRVLALPENNPQSLRRPLCGQRRVAWLDDLPFAPIRRRAHALQVKINDLFLAALAGAFGCHLRETEGRLDSDQNLRISIPVNLRSADDGELGNCFGLVLLDLPVGVSDWRERLRIVARRMQELKNSPEAKAVLVGLAAAGHMPVSWEKSLVRLLAGKAAAVVSNLPGPRHAVRVAGARLDKLVFWPPQTGGIGIGISLFSYAGRVTVGVSADSAQLADPAGLVHAFKAEMELMLHPRRHAPRRSVAALDAAAAAPAADNETAIGSVASRPVRLHRSGVPLH